MTTQRMGNAIPDSKKIPKKSRGEIRDTITTDAISKEVNPGQQFLLWFRDPDPAFSGTDPGPGLLPPVESTILHQTLDPVPTSVHI